MIEESLKRTIQLKILEIVETFQEKFQQLDSNEISFPCPKCSQIVEKINCKKCNSTKLIHPSTKQLSFLNEMFNQKLVQASEMYKEANEIKEKEVDGNKLEEEIINYKIQIIKPFQQSKINVRPGQIIEEKCIIKNVSQQVLPQNFALIEEKENKKVMQAILEPGENGVVNLRFVARNNIGLYQTQ